MPKSWKEAENGAIFASENQSQGQTCRPQGRSSGPEREGGNPAAFAKQAEDANGKVRPRLEKEIINKTIKKKRKMKKILFSMMMLAMMATSFSLTSCSADDIADSITTALVQKPMVKKVWRNDNVDENTTVKTIKYLDIYEKEGTQKAEFQMVEVQNGVKYVSRGVWSISSNGNMLTLEVQSGSRQKGTMRCQIKSVSLFSLEMNIEGTSYNFTETKTRELESYIQ